MQKVKNRKEQADKVQQGDKIRKGDQAGQGYVKCEPEYGEDSLDAAIREAIGVPVSLPEHFKENLVRRIPEAEKTQERLFLKNKTGGLFPYVRFGFSKKTRDTASRKKRGIRYLTTVAAVLALIVLIYPLMERTMSYKNAPETALPDDVSRDVSDSALFAPAAEGKMVTDQAMGMEEKGNQFEPASPSERAPASSSDSLSPSLPSSEDSSQRSFGKKKIIENYHLGIKTKQFEDSKAMIDAIAAESGGFVSQYDMFDGGEDSLKTASIVLKIPSERAERYKSEIDRIGEIYRESKSIEDVTKYYGEIEVEISNLQKAEARYLALYENAETIEDMISLEKELSRIRGMIDIKKASLLHYDYLVAYSTFYIELMEVKEYVPIVSVEPGTWEKAKNGFVEGVNQIIRTLQQIFIVIVSILPALVSVLIALTVIFFGIRIFTKRGKRSRSDDPAGESGIKTEGDSASDR